MNDMGDIKVSRKNVMLISSISILLLLFSTEIKEINILGIIKIENIQNGKILGLLLLVNLYIFLRYLISFNSENPKVDNKKIFKFLVNTLFASEINNKENKVPRNFKGIIYYGHEEKKGQYYISVSEHNCIMICEKNIDFYMDHSRTYKNIFSDKVIVKRYGLYKFHMYLIDELPNPSGIHLEIDKSPKNTITLLKIYLKFIIKNNYILDYYLPFLMILFSIFYIIKNILT